MSHDRPILNIADVDPQPLPMQAPGALADKYESKMGPIGARIGARKLGYNLTIVPPGKRAFPRHNHHVNEEMFFVLVGSGEVRIGERTFAIKQGDVVACPPGGPESAHQIVNTGASEMRYLAVSTKLSPEIAEYPDSGKFGVLGELATDGAPRMVRYLGRLGDSLEYWDGER
jgi:uncharacterized cupin superfamily protein